MANQPLDYLAFPCSRRKRTAAGGTRVVAGHFICRRNTARFLDIESQAEQGAKIIIVERKEHTRELKLADGTVLGAEGGGGVANVAKSEIALAINMGGSKTVRLITGKQTEKKNFQQLSFRFPSFMHIKGICDALGTLIPVSKVKWTPAATDVKPFFITEGGKRYYFMEPAAAAQEEDVKILAQADPPEGGTAIEAAPEE